MRCRHTVEAGVYVLGALAPADRAAYERHLATCPDCRAEVAELAGLPGLLGRLDPGTAASIVTPAEAAQAQPALLDSVLRRVGRERRRQAARRRWQYAGAAFAAACLALVVGLGVSIVDNGGRPPGPVVAEMQPVEQDIPVTALLAYQADGKGLTYQMVCVYREVEGYSPDTTWKVHLVLYPKDGGPAVDSDTWAVKAGQEANQQQWLPMKPSELARAELVTDTGTRLLVFQPT